MMKDRENQEDGARLEALLQEWQLESDWSTRRQAVVCYHIAVGETPPVSFISKWLFRLNGWLLQPQGAGAALLVFALIGSGLGWVSGQDRLDRHSQTMTTQYVRSVDPYQMNPALFQ